MRDRGCRYFSKEKSRGRGPTREIVMGTAIYPPFERATANRTCAARLEIPRLFGEHRPVYRVSDERSEQRLEIVQCRHHY
jgi:hypothetical protein